MNFLLTLVNASDRPAVIQTNFERIDRSLAFKLTPSLDLAGDPTADIGPPTTGAHVLDELWVDAGLTVWRCTVAGTPGTWFPAIGYRVYRALLTQSGTDAPTTTVLENTLGDDVVWSYDSAGAYVATLAGAFPSNKTFILPAIDPSGGLVYWAVLSGGQPDAITINAVSGDDALNATAFQILVYP